ncbi:hypothetical protein [Burkholderia vietnamiensis]|uniref:hypothetical protein n=1 Tax=Burkholderia vietnamiensis TaxID=60552 RepID=UPI001CF2CDCF|nr:hypothetical protein [Burkholderia vietnamiensis]MCA8448976.1 hypothetical protein [Burkholderia vietnamiensis]
MHTFAPDVPTTDTFVDHQDHAQEVEITPAVMLRFAIMHADLPQIRSIVEDSGIDLRDKSSRPAGVAFTVIKHLGARKTVEQHEALAWFLENGLYDDNFKLKAVVERMVAAGVGGDPRLGGPAGFTS